ncbi:MAG: hypothetical protein ACI89X_005035 [Planctomycetota bacterium]|jgi:hypothetical protein
MKTATANEAKACFDSIYNRHTPHDYCSYLGDLDYSICDEIRPFADAAASLLQEWESRVRMVDIGCSYGINAAALKHDILFAELARFFEANVPKDPEAAHKKVKAALAKNDAAIEMECVGLDISAPAVGFACNAGLLDHGVVADLERGPETLSATDREWIRGANLLLATGAIGYVTDRTVNALLRTMAGAAPNAVVLLTVLRVFDSESIIKAVSQHGLKMASIESVLLPQRRFHTADEQSKIVRVLDELGLDSTPERSGRHYAKLLVAARPDRLPILEARMGEIAASRMTLKANPQCEEETQHSIAEVVVSGNSIALRQRELR